MNAKNKKILHISRTMGQGGAEKIVEQLCCDIKDQNFIVASAGGYRVKNLEKHHIVHYVIPDIASKNPLNMLKILGILSNIVENEQIDAIHSHHRMAAFYAQLLKRKYPNLHLIYTAHNVYNDKKKLSYFSFKNTQIIACGKSVEKNLIDFYKLPRARITTITNSIKPPKLTPLDILPPKSNNQIYLASISRLVDDKGIDIFISALNIIKKNSSLNFQTFIIGDGKQRRILEKQTRRLNLDQNITFLGFQKDALSIIGAIDIIVSPSRREGLPLTIIELLALGKPVIVSDIENHKEIIIDNKNGLLFKSGDAKKLAEQIEKLAVNPKLRSKISQSSKAAYNNYCNYASFLEKYNLIYGGNNG